ncbi:MAG: quinolinate synthase NadA [Zoogloeaceae bacterium]|jgi:quinolinate synthase|nr:quinolinate synthase NadA [Zoogloeaceae bacterium]
MTASAAPLPFSAYRDLSGAQCDERIVAARRALGKEVVLLCHHYQRAEVYRHADLTGDSLKLARLAAQTDARFLVFCGVHFMAEVAEMLSRPEQTVILPDLAAGCSMADMANLAKVERCWRELAEVCDANEIFTPVTYINSAADLKAFCGERGGIVCTSSNAGEVARWAFRRRQKILFFPDQHLGRWTGHSLGVPLEEMRVWDPDVPLGGLLPEEIARARILLWKGHCAVHQMFRKSQIDAFRAQYPEGRVLAHPECEFAVAAAADEVGSTEFIVNRVKQAASPGHWLIGTELNLVERLAREVAAEGKIVRFMSPLVCMCSTMQRIDLPHLAWTLENLAQGAVVNPISVPEKEAESARQALARMLELS